MVTVEVDSARVESRLSAGEIQCPCCDGGVLGRWGYARARQVVGTDGPVRPRRGRCRNCLMTHVLLPVTLLLRRAYLADLIYAAVSLKATGSGHRRIAARLRIPESTVRGWLRVIDGRAKAVRDWFVAVAVAAGVDVSIPKATGSGYGEVLAAIEVARRALSTRFAAAPLVSTLTAAQIAVACSSGRLLSPDWPSAPFPDARNTN